jgi:hypothetical protein
MNDYFDNLDSTENNLKYLTLHHRDIYEAYENFGTSYAWILGSILIGFTYMQLRILRRVDFRQAKGD